MTKKSPSSKGNSSKLTKTNKNKKTISQPLEFKSTAEQIQHYNAILIEDLSGKFNMVIDHMNNVETRLVRRMDETDAKNERRFQDIESILKVHSKMLQENEKRWDENDKRWKENNKRWDENDKCWKNVYHRLDAIDTKLDSVCDKVENHEERLDRIESALNFD